jgi:hypothetical protein
VHAVSAGRVKIAEPAEDHLADADASHLTDVSSGSDRTTLIAVLGVRGDVSRFPS